MIIKRMMSRGIDGQKQSRWYGISLLIGFCLLCAFTATKVTMSISTGLPQTSWLLAAAGFLVAGIFAYASLHEIDEQKNLISPLYSADLIGGCLGSLLGSLVLIPLVGMDATARGMLLLAASSLFLL